MPPHKDMTKVIPPPEREAIEREIHALFTNGDLSDIARLLHKDQSLVSKMFNPYSDEKHNPVFTLISFLWAMDAIRDDLAGEVLNIILREREKWLPVEAKYQDAGRLTHNIVQEFGEFIEAELDGKDWSVQVSEIMDVINAADAKKKDILAKRNGKHLGVAK